MSKQPVACEDYEQELSLLAAGCLSEEETHRISKHLADCDACRAHLDQLTVLCERLTAARPPVSASDLQRLKKNYVAGIAQPVPRLSWTSGWVMVAGIAVAASLAALVLIQLSIRKLPNNPDQAVRPSVPTVPMQEEPTLTSVTSQPVTWLEFQHALSDSDEALNQLLDQEADRLTFLSRDTSAHYVQELLP